MAAGNLSVSDSGDWEGKGGGAAYRVTQASEISALPTGDEAETRDGKGRLYVSDYKDMVAGDLVIVPLQG